MSWLNLSDISAMANGRLHGSARPVERVCIDSRRTVAGDLFIALKGPRFDGHDFAQRSVRRGAVAALVSRRLDVDVPQILVADTMPGLKATGSGMAAAARRPGYRLDRQQRKNNRQGNAARHFFALPQGVGDFGQPEQSHRRGIDDAGRPPLPSGRHCRVGRESSRRDR